MKNKIAKYGTVFILLITFLASASAETMEFSSNADAEMYEQYGVKALGVNFNSTGFQINGLNLYNNYTSVEPSPFTVSNPSGTVVRDFSQMTYYSSNSTLYFNTPIQVSTTGQWRFTKDSGDAYGFYESTGVTSSQGKYFNDWTSYFACNADGSGCNGEEGTQHMYYFHEMFVESTNSPPSIGSINTNPSSPTYNEQVDVSVEVTDDSSVSQVNATVKENGTVIVDNQELTDGDNDNVYDASNLFNTDKTSDYSITIDAVDDAGATSSKTRTITIPNDPPVIQSFTHTPDPVQVNDQVTFKANITDAQGNDNAPTISIVDNGVQNVVNDTMTLNNGLYEYTYTPTTKEVNVNATAHVNDTDDTWDSAKDSFYVNFDNTAPTFDSTSISPSSPDVNDSISLYAQVSDSDSNLKGVNVSVTNSTGVLVNNASMSFNSPKWEYLDAITATESSYTVKYRAYDGYDTTVSSLDFTVQKTTQSEPVTDQETSSTGWKEIMVYVIALGIVIVLIETYI